MTGFAMAKETEEVKKKKKGTGRTTTAIQLDTDLVRMASVIASHRRITQSALIEPVLRNFLTAQYRLVKDEIGKELKDGPG